MWRILRNRIIRNHSKVLVIIVILALLFFILINLNSNQMRADLLIVKDAYGTHSKKSQTSNNITVLLTGDVNSSLSTATRTTVPEASTATSSYNIKPTNKQMLNFTTVKLVYSPTVGYRIGHVHSHLWYKMCTFSFHGVRQHPLFPLWPSVRGQPEMPDELESIMTAIWSLQRVFGLLYPPISGKYRFKIYSATLSEFWLSSSPNPENATLLARNNKNVLFGIEYTQGRMVSTSKPVQLNQGQSYYFEILHGMNNVRRGKVRVRWMLPGAETYTGIPKSAVSTFVKVDDNLDTNTRKLLSSSASLVLQTTTLKKTKLHQWKEVNFAKPFQPYLSYNRKNLHTLEFANHWKIMSAFLECEYSPSYTVKRNYKRYEGVYHTHYSDVFPDDDTGDKYWGGGEKTWMDILGNTVVKEAVVIDIVKKFMAQVEAEFPGEYALANVINVERNVDAERGNRFFLDLVLLDKESKNLQRLSEYVFQFKKDPAHLCKPKGLNWSSTVKVNAILTTKNQGPWVIHYIKNMAEIIHATGDNNVHFIIVDYGNNGVDVADEFKRNNLTSFTLIKKEGKFHKTLAIDEAAKSIKDDNSIVFLTDLHLSAPHSIFENVRKHTIQGKMAFTPVVFRLTHCSRPETEETSTANGFWETYGYGIFSTYKSDWNNFGGVNVKEFQYKWGGEDWEMADRVLSKGIEIERLRLPHFYHFHHDKSGMWQ